MIISCSRRTDIPAFYSDWLFKRIEESFCLVPNPLNSRQVSKVSLLPEDVTAFVFWTRNPAPMLDKLYILDKLKYKYYFLYTLNNYPAIYEPHKPSPEGSLKTFSKLSDKIGTGRVIWRYDPIFLSEDITSAFHLKNFEFLCKALSGSTDKVITSLLYPYRKTMNRMNKTGRNIFFNLRELEETDELLSSMVQIAKSFNLALEICSEEKDFSHTGIGRAKCIDEALLEREFGIKIEYQKDTNQRPNCNCMKSKDIGINNTCLMGCEYCYATVSHSTAIKNKSKFNI